MANRIISIEVGYSVTKVCEMDFRSKNPKVYKYFSVPTPEGVYDDGFLTENPQFATTIKQALGFNKIKTKQAVCTITSSKIATREVQLPVVKDSQLPALVEANAGDYFPINLADYELGHLVLGNIKDSDGTNKLKVMVMACNKQLISGYDKLCEACGLHLISVDYSGNSVYQIMKNEIKEDTEMVIKVEEKQALATIITGQSMVMQRNIVYGFENAVFAMMNNSAFPQKTYEEALEELKRIRCIRIVLNDSTKIIEKEDDELQVSEKVKAAMIEVTDALAPLIGNVERVIDLYNSKSPDHPIRKISIIGLGADISGLSKLFTNEVGIKTVVCSNVKTINWNHTVGEGNSGRYVSTIGAGIAPIGFINEEKKKSDLKDVNYRNVSILVVVFTVIVCGLLIFKGYSDYTAQESKKKQLQKLENMYLPGEAVQKQYNSVSELYGLVRQGYNHTFGPNDNLIAFLTELEQVLPEDAIVTNIQSGLEAANVTIKVLDLDIAAKVLDNVRSFKVARDVQVVGIEQEEMSMSEYRQLLVDKGILSPDVLKKNEDVPEGEQDNSDIEDEDGNRITTFTDEDGNEIVVSDKYYKFNFTVVYTNDHDDEAVIVEE